jgi:magnesium transporter
MIQVALFQQDGTVQLGHEELLDTPLPEGGAVWIDLEGRTQPYEQRLLDWGFHPLAVEDVFTLQHHPKVETYPDHVFLIVRGIDFNRERLETLKLAAFLQSSRLVTCHRAPMRSVTAVRQTLAETGRGRPRMPHLLYRLCDEMVDLYFPIIDGIGAELEELEEQIFDDPRKEQLEALRELSRRLSTVRRVMLPHRQVFNHLASRQMDFIDDQEALYFRDVFDNVFRLADAVDQQREQLAAAKESYLSMVAQRTNDVMKVLTLFSATLLPLTFIAGVYGMNFEYMPETEWHYGYFGTLGVMAGLVVGMLWWFRRRGWL